LSGVLKSLANSLARLLQNNNNAKRRTLTGVFNTPTGDFYLLNNEKGAEVGDADRPAAVPGKLKCSYRDEEAYFQERPC